jgi:hypothetical protein
MTLTISPEERGPATESTLAWRWTRSSHAVFPEEQLRQIFTLSAAAAARADSAASRLAQTRPSQLLSLDVASLPDAQVSTWLASLPVDAGARVVASWSEAVAVELPWILLVERWSDFCYPSSDDVYVLPLDGGWLLTYDHEESFLWRGWEAT